MAPRHAAGFFFLGGIILIYSIFSLIVDTVAGVLVGVLLLRFWMQAIRVRPPNSLGQFAFQLTDWLVRPLRKLVPGVAGYDWATLIGAILVMLVAVSIDVLLGAGVSPKTIFVLTLLRLLQWVLYGFMGLILVETIFSWVNPQAPLAPFISALNAPFLRPLRRIVPMIGNIDLSPLAALLLLQIALRLVSALLLPFA